VPDERPHYVVVAERGDPHGVASNVESALLRLHHYALARELGQLGPARAIIAPDALTRLLAYSQRLGLAAGEAKIETLAEWRGERHPSEEL
jgi:hypothetical protein